MPINVVVSVLQKTAGFSGTENKFTETHKSTPALKFVLILLLKMLRVKKLISYFRAKPSPETRSKFVRKIVNF